MERVIVTGATSMIGEALIEECLKHGISVCAVIRKDTARKDRLPQDPHLELVECSLEELAALPEKVTGSFDTFYHIAWGYTGAARNKSTRLQSKNIDYTLDAVEAAAKLGCKRFIGACDHQCAHSPDIRLVAILDTDIDDVCHNDRNQQFKTGFQHFKQWCNNRLFFIRFQILKHLFHLRFPPALLRFSEEQAFSGKYLSASAVVR